MTRKWTNREARYIDVFKWGGFEYFNNEQYKIWENIKRNYENRNNVSVISGSGHFNWSRSVDDNINFV